MKTKTEASLAAMPLLHRATRQKGVILWALYLEHLSSSPQRRKKHGRRRDAGRTGASNRRSRSGEINHQPVMQTNGAEGSLALK